jgi:hypothetical protein
MKKIEMEDFFTQPQSEDGAKLELMLPDGSGSGHYLIIRGFDSKAYKVAEVKALRESRQSVIKYSDDSGKVTPDKEVEIFEKAELFRASSLVSSWSFKHDCNSKNVMEFLEKAPHIKESIIEFSSKRSNFFTKPSSS